MDFKEVSFLNPVFLNLLAVPAFLFVIWLYKFRVRRRDVNRYLTGRIVPLKERYLFGGKHFAWLCLIAALVLSIAAMARPRYTVSVMDAGAVDLIALLDGSASSRVPDVEPGDRWQRSVQWLKTLVRTMRWDGDRLALAVFARRASPHVRITSDPNVVMFFLAHLDKEPPIPLNDNTAWDTNIAEAIYWSLRLVEKDTELYGDSGNPKAFVLISDGQAWSGEVREVITDVVNILRIPIFVVGVGTDTGGLIPPPPANANCYWDDELGQQVCPPPDPDYEPVHSSIDRASLQQIANDSRGRYFELGRTPDTEIAASIVNMTRLRNTDRKTSQKFKELYWELMLGAMLFVGLSMFFLFKQ